MAQKKFFIKNSNPVFNCLKELTLALYYKPYIRCNILDDVFILDDGYSLSHIKSSALLEESVGRSFLSTRIVYRHKQVSSFKLNSFLSYHFLEVKNVAATLVNNLKLYTHRDENFGSKVLFVLSAVKGGFFCYSGGFRGFIPSSHHKETISYFISHVVVNNRPEILTFCFIKGRLIISTVCPDPDDLDTFLNESGYYAYRLYSFFRLGLLMVSSSIGCMRTFNNFSRSQSRKNSRLDINLVFLTYDSTYKVLEKRALFSFLLLKRLERRLSLRLRRFKRKYRKLRLSKVRGKLYKEFTNLIVRQTNHEKIKDLIDEIDSLSLDFFISDDCLTKCEKRLKDYAYKYIYVFDFHELTQKKLDDLKKECAEKNFLTSPPKIEYGPIRTYYLGKLSTPFFDDLFIKKNRGFFYLDFFLTGRLEQILSVKTVTKKMLIRLVVQHFSFYFLKKTLIAKYNK